jgi:hypothetical protein
MENEKDNKKTKQPPHPPLKPAHPHVEGAPDDNDPKAQYEDKDES